MNKIPELQHGSAYSLGKSQDYFSNKKAKQAEHAKIAFKVDTSTLKQFHFDFKVLAPNFFTKTLPMKQCETVPMPNHEENALENSFIQMLIPVKQDIEIQNSLIRLATTDVRIGRILECMDSLAGIVAYKHCFGTLLFENPFILVTACADKLNLFESITILEDIILEGFVNHVGKTSMEIEINLFQGQALKATALFTMVSRNAKDYTKSYPCPKLKLSHLSPEQLDKANIRQRLAMQNVQRRKKQMKESLKIKPPSEADAKIIHDIFLNQTQISKEEVDIDSTTITFIELMHAQQRNLNNKIFGGFLMSSMVENGWIAASRFALDDSFSIEDITDIYFKQPVEIGCQLKLKSKVAYTFNDIIVVTIEASTGTFHPQFKQKLCCHMNLFLRANRQMKRVYPRSYEDGICFLSSKNAYNRIFESFQNTGI